MLSAPASAAPPTRAELPKPCREWGGADVLALACDPGGRAAEIHLRLGAERAGASGERGIARLGSDEPLQAGETVSLRWRHPSARAVLSLTAMAAERPRQVVLDLSARPASVDVTAQADGSLLVTTPAGSATVPAPVDVVWEPRTAHAAAGQLLSAVDRMESSTRALSTLCAALDRDVFSFFELFLGAPERYPCVSAMALFVFGDENVPRPTSTIHRGSALAVGRGRALLSTTLTHRYQSSSQSDPTRVVVRARLPLVRDSQGIWRLATVEPLLPLSVVDHRQAYTDAELARSHRRFAASGRKLAAEAARQDAARQAATVDGAAPAPCGVALVADPRGDVVVQEASERARDQAAHADVDLTGVGLAGRCLAIRSAGPLPARFEITLRDDRDAPDRELEVAVTDGRVVVLDTTEDDTVPKPLRGAAAHLDPDGLVVALPVTLSGTVQVVLGVDRSQVRYSDDASVLRGAHY